MWLVDNRSLPVPEIMKRVNKSLLGHFNYYGVPTNVRQLEIFKSRVQRLILKTLNRRSQRKSYTWNEFSSKILGKFPLAKARIYAYV
jgi:hypothetical protein